MFLRTRFAPTPSGYLHPGNLLNLAICWRVVHTCLPEPFLLSFPELARQAESTAQEILNSLGKLPGGEMLLRIDDLDHDRLRDAYLRDISQTLITYGFHPANIHAENPETWRLARQSGRIARFDALLNRLQHHPEVFACTCSRAQSGQKPYSGTCRHRNIPLSTPGAAWRIEVPYESVITVPDVLSGTVNVPIGRNSGSFIIRRKDGIPAYQLASVIDDDAMGINLIIRGMDLLESTAQQLYLAGKLELPGFSTAKFAHHALLVDQDGKKLSKSNITLL